MVVGLNFLSVGWINRGLDWTDVVDTPEEYALTIHVDHPDLRLR